MKISQGLLPLSLLIALVPSVASANYSQPHRAVVGGIDRLYIPGNAGRSPVAINFLEETNLIYPVNSGWIRVSNSKLDVVEVGGVFPSGGLIPSGVYYGVGSRSPFLSLQVVRRKV